MTPELPTTVIGLIGFVVLGAGYILYRMFESSNQRSKDNVAQFMGYIENKNGIVLKQAEAFAAALKDMQSRFDQSLVNQSERHQETMQHFSERLESLLPDKRITHDHK